MKSLEDLKKIRENMQSQMGIRTEGHDKTRIIVGMATCGIASGARPVLTALSDIVLQKGLKDVSIVQTGCIGLCQHEPIVEVLEPGKDKVTYIKMTPEKAQEIIDQHIIRGQVVSKYTISGHNE